jgi:FlaA1/EpsC-like NDP-sugar epimerase
MSFLSGQTVLVTGGTGSIGSEIVRQGLASGAAVVRVFSRDESKQAALRSELGGDPRVRFLIGDVRDQGRVRRALSGVDTVFHAAAMKYVGVCDYNPFEAVQTNILGTQHVIEAALDTNVSRAVFVSTDKAVNPVSTMGATKLVAERMVAAANQWIRHTRLSAVRFGNVLGSRGSIVPEIVRQIRQGDAVRLTHPAMTRFMMSIADAVRLVLLAAEEAKGGEIFVFKMPSLRVKDLIYVLIEEVAPRFGKDPASIRLVAGGTWPGEKVDEELLTAEERERTEERDRYFVVHPAWRQEGGFPSTRAIDPGWFDSGRGKFLDAAGIRRLLADAGALYVDA